MTAPRPRPPAELAATGPGQPGRGQHTRVRDAPALRAAQPVRRVVPVADLTTAYVVDMGAAGVLLSSAQATLDVLAALDGAVRAQRSTGIPVRREVLALADTLRQHLAELTEAERCRARQSAMPEEADRAAWEPTPEVVTVAEAAQLLGLRDRQVRNLATSGQLPGRKVAGSWQLDRTAVIGAADNRKEPSP